MLALTHSLLLAALSAAQSSAPVAVAGAAPTLPEPDPRLLPTIHIARAVGWAADATPTAAAGLAVEAFATGLDHPRWLYVLPNGDVLVAETNAPPRPDDSKGIRGWIMKRVMARAGAGGPSADRISLLRDADGDGRADLKTTFVSGLTSPFGMALVDRNFYVANTDAIVRFDYEPGATAISSPPGPVVALPAGTRNHHWTKGLIASPNGTLLYVTVGSNSNVAEHGMDQESNRAAILEVSLGTRQTRVFASGLRNPNGLAWEPTTGALWTTVNERDGLGDDLVPDYLTSVQPGGFYGWPYSYFGAHVDERVEPQRPELVAAAIVPDYALGAHPAALGLAFYEGNALPARYRGGAFIGLHGSWNRRELAGYKVIFVPFAAGRPAGPAEDVLTGFLSEDDDRAFGRPAGVAVDLRGGLLVADDVGNAVWRVTAAPRGAAR